MDGGRLPESMQRIPRTQLGLLALVASGVLTVVGLLLRGPVLVGDVNPDAFFEDALSGRTRAALLLLLVGLVVQLYGFLGLYAALDSPPNERMALGGLVSSLAGNGLFLPFAGAFTFVLPALARLYQAGETEVVRVVTQGILGGPSLAFLIASATLLVVGSLLFAVALWRDGALPRWSALPYALHAPLVTFWAQIAYPAEFAGGVLLLAAALWIAWAVWRQSA